MCVLGTMCELSTGVRLTEARWDRRHPRGFLSGGWRRAGSPLGGMRSSARERAGRPGGIERQKEKEEEMSLLSARLLKKTLPEIQSDKSDFLCKHEQNMHLLFSPFQCIYDFQMECKKAIYSLLKMCFFPAPAHFRTW